MKKEIKEKKEIKKETKKELKKEKKVLKKFYFSVGRRKEAIAKTKLVVEKGEIMINGKSFETYFPEQISKIAYIEPFRTTNMLDRWSGFIKVMGGGHKSQLHAVILAISRCLVQFDSERFRPILRKRGFLTRDPRVKERKKPGLMGARKKKQSPKR